MAGIKEQQEKRGFCSNLYSHSGPAGNVISVVSLQHIDKVFKHKELQQQLMDAKLQRITEMMKEVEEKQQRERDFVRISVCSGFYRSCK